MKAYEGYEAKKTENTFTLPAGGYVAGIVDARVESTDNGEKLVLSFDILEGEFTGFFQNQYDNRSFEDQKWKGNFRLWVPEKSHKFFESERKAFNNSMFAFEASNPGYHWNWDENGLKGKLVGVIFRDREWEYNGKTGMTTECFSLASVEDIRTGNFKVPKPRMLKKKEEAADEPAYHPISAEDCPF